MHINFFSDIKDKLNQISNVLSRTRRPFLEWRHSVENGAILKNDTILLKVASFWGIDDQDIIVKLVENGIHELGLSNWHYKLGLMNVKCGICIHHLLLIAWSSTPKNGAIF